MYGTRAMDNNDEGIKHETRHLPENRRRPTAYDRGAWTRGPGSATGHKGSAAEALSSLAPATASAAAFAAIEGTPDVPTARASSSAPRILRHPLYTQRVDCAWQPGHNRLVIVRPSHATQMVFRGSQRARVLQGGTPVPRTRTHGAAASPANVPKSLVCTACILSACMRECTCLKRVSSFGSSCKSPSAEA